MTKCEPVESHADRPIAKTILPFRIGNELGYTYLEYHNTLPSGQHQPFILDIGDENSSTAKQFNSLGINIMQLMRMYWGLEQQIDGLMKERDELLTQVQITMANMSDCQKKADEYQRRYNDLKEKHPQDRDRKKNGG
jgi:hypothetical protein